VAPIGAFNPSDQGPPPVLTETSRGIKSLNLRNISGAACLVSGSCGLYSYQNLTNSNLYDVEKPQGMLIKCDSTGEPESLKYIRDQAAPKPRLAVRCDYLWYENQIPMFHMGEWRVRGLVAQESENRGLIYKMCVNPKWLAYFSQDGHHRNAIFPINHITLHFVSRVTGRYVKGHMVRFNVDPTPKYPFNQHKDVPVYEMDGGPEKIKKARDNLSITLPSANEPLLAFFSVHFVASHPLGAQYDLDSPWCFPVYIPGSDSYIARKIGRDGELPNFNLLSKITEYRYPSQSNNP
jgi:hypothetical protein